MESQEQHFVKFATDDPITIGTLHNSNMLDGSTVTDFSKEVLDFVSQHPRTRLLLDFQNVDYLSSAALTELIKINDSTVAGGGGLRLCGLSEEIYKVFEITNFDKMFEAHKGEDVKKSVERYKRSIAINKEEDAWQDRHKNWSS